MNVNSLKSEPHSRGVAAAGLLAGALAPATPRLTDRILLDQLIEVAGQIFDDEDAAQLTCRKQKFLDQLRTELIVSAEVEEEVFYPALSTGAGAS